MLRHPFIRKCKRRKLLLEDLVDQSLDQLERHRKTQLANNLSGSHENRLDNIQKDDVDTNLQRFSPEGPLFEVNDTGTQVIYQTDSPN